MHIHCFIHLDYSENTEKVFLLRACMLLTNDGSQLKYSQNVKTILYLLEIFPQIQHWNQSKFGGAFSLGYLW